MSVSEGENGQIETKLNSFAPRYLRSSRKLRMSVRILGLSPEVRSMFNPTDSSSQVVNVTVCEGVSDISESFGIPILRASQSERRCGAFNISGFTDKHYLNRVASIACMKQNFWNLRRKPVRA